MDNETEDKPLILHFGRKLKYAFDIARAANGYAHYATKQGYDEPRESYGYTKQLLGRDVQIIDERVDVQDYYIGRGRRSLELSAALEIAIGVFACKITDVLRNTPPDKMNDIKRQFGLHGVFANDDEDLKNAAQGTAFVSDEVARFLSQPDNREQMRQRFPDAQLTDELINQFLPKPI